MALAMLLGLVTGVGTWFLLNLFVFAAVGFECDRSDAGTVGNYLCDAEWIGWAMLAVALLASVVAGRRVLRRM